jgi:hypothetical protein
MSSYIQLVFYFYAIIGMELFAEIVPTIEPFTNYNKFWFAMLTLVNLFTTSNWHGKKRIYINSLRLLVIMYTAMRATSNYAAWYFVSFHVFVVIIIMK